MFHGVIQKRTLAQFFLRHGVYAWEHSYSRGSIDREFIATSNINCNSSLAPVSFVGLRNKFDDANSRPRLSTNFRPFM